MRAFIVRHRLGLFALSLLMLVLAAEYVIHHFNSDGFRSPQFWAAIVGGLIGFGCVVIVTETD